MCQPFSARLLDTASTLYHPCTCRCPTPKGAGPSAGTVLNKALDIFISKFICLSFTPYKVNPKPAGIKLSRFN